MTGIQQERLRILERIITTMSTAYLTLPMPLLPTEGVYSLLQFKGVATGDKRNNNARYMKERLLLQSD